MKGTITLNKENTNRVGNALPLFFFAAIFAAIAICIQGIAVVLGYDPAMQVYKTNSILGTISAIVIFAEIVIFTLMTVMMLKGGKRLSALPQASDTSAFLSSAAGCMIIVSSVLLFFESQGYVGTASNVTLWMTIVSIPSGMYFILSTFKNKNEQLLSYLGFFPVIWTALCLLRIYFDVGAAINDPLRILFQLSFVAIILALLFELKVRVGKNGTIPLIIFSGIAIILGSASVLSMTILFIIPKTVSTGEILLSASEFLICLDLLVKMYSELKEI